MAKARSPRYPAIGLREAVEKARLIFEKDHRNRIPPEVAVQHMGYSGLNGKSLGVISALRKFGLLEDTSDGARISDDALVILAHEPGSSERVERLASLAISPPLFAELERRFPDERASDAAIRTHLITNGFLPAAADSVVRSFRETIAFVQEERRAHSFEPQRDVEETAAAEDASLADARGRGDFFGSGGNAQVATPPQFRVVRESGDARSVNDEVHNYRLSRSCTAELRFRGQVTQSAIDKLRKYLEDAKDTYPVNVDTALVDA